MRKQQKKTAISLHLSDRLHTAAAAAAAAPSALVAGEAGAAAAALAGDDGAALAGAGVEVEPWSGLVTDGALVIGGGLGTGGLLTEPAL